MFTSLALAGVAALGFATSASAVTFCATSVYEGAGAVTISGNQTTYDCTQTAFSGGFDFSFGALETVTMSLANYARNILSDVSGFTITDTVTKTVLTHDTNLCARSGAAEIPANCNLVGATNSTNSNNPAEPGDDVIVLGAGAYAFGLYDSAAPVNGQTTFAFGAAVVPLPAGGLLLLSGFGAVAALRRRRKAS